MKRLPKNWEAGGGGGLGIFLGLKMKLVFKDSPVFIKHAAFCQNLTILSVAFWLFFLNRGCRIYLVYI